MSTTPTTPHDDDPPQWAMQQAAQAWCASTTKHIVMDHALAREFAHMLAERHSPSPAAQPTDEAKLREVIFDVLREPGFWGLSMHDCANRMTAALAPHLSQREPGDSELLDWLDKHHNWILCAESESPTFSCGSNENFQNWALKVPTVRAAIRAAIKSAQRGEGKP